MKKTSENRIQRTLTLDEGIDQRLRELSQKLKKPISHIVEEAVEIFLERLNS